VKKILQALGLLVFLAASSCADETDAIREATSLYWQAILAGDFDSAYRMISRESRVRYERGEFEEGIALTGFTDNEKLARLWVKEADFVIEDIKQRGRQATVFVAIHVPDVEGLRTGLFNEAGEKNIERKTKGDSTKIEEWFTKRITEEIRRGKFDLTVIDIENKLIREAGIWKVVYDG